MDRKTLNVLLIEDSPDYAELAQQWLSSTGEDVAFVLRLDRLVGRRPGPLGQGWRGCSAPGPGPAR
jgi:hypothetical protein